MSQLAFYGLTSCSTFLGSCGHSQPLEPCVYKGTSSIALAAAVHKGGHKAAALLHPHSGLPGNQSLGESLAPGMSIRSRVPEKTPKVGLISPCPLEVLDRFQGLHQWHAELLRKRPKYLCSRRLGDFLTHSALGYTIGSLVYLQEGSSDWVPSGLTRHLRSAVASMESCQLSPHLGES